MMTSLTSPHIVAASMKSEQHPGCVDNGGYEWLVRWTCLALLLAATVFHVGLPLEEDQRSSLACSEQGEYLSAFPATIIDSYHLRGISHKLLNYMIYKTLKGVIGCDDKFHFEVGVKVFSACLYLSICALSVWFARVYLRRRIVSLVACWTLLSAGLLTTSSDVHLQAEELSVALVFLGLGMSLNPSRFVQVLAGLPLALTFSMKGVTLALGSTAIVARFAIEPHDWRAVLRLTLSFITCSAAVVGATCVFFPQEVRDLLDTAFIEGAQFSISERVQNTLHAVRSYLNENPMVISGLIAAIPVFLHYMDTRRLLSALGLAVLWSVPVVPVLVQGKGFMYHITGFLIPGLLTVILLHAIVRSKGLARPWQVGAVCIPVLICFLFTGPFAIFGGFSYVKIMKRAYAERRLFSKWNAEFNLPGQPEILYLTAGDAAYYVRAKSHLRYFVPISIQRIARNPRLRETERFRMDLAAAMSYSGKYIVIDEKWLEKPFNELPELRRKMDSEYCRVASGGAWAIFERRQGRPLTTTYDMPRR